MRNVRLTDAKFGQFAWRILAKLRDDHLTMPPSEKPLARSCHLRKDLIVGTEVRRGSLGRIEGHGTLPSVGSHCRGIAEQVDRRSCHFAHGPRLEKACFALCAVSDFANVSEGVFVLMAHLGSPGSVLRAGSSALSPPCPHLGPNTFRPRPEVVLISLNDLENPHCVW